MGAIAAFVDGLGEQEVAEKEKEVDGNREEYIDLCWVEAGLAGFEIKLAILFTDFPLFNIIGFNNW